MSLKVPKAARSACILVLALAPAACNTNEYQQNRARGAATQQQLATERARNAYDRQQTERAQQIQMQQTAERTRAQQYLNDR